MHSLEKTTLSLTYDQDSVALPSLPCTLYFHHVDRTCNARACCRHGARSTANTRVQTTTAYSSWFPRRCNRSNLAELRYCTPGNSLLRIDPGGSLCNLEDDIRPSTLYCRRCRMCNGLVRHRLEEHRIPYSSRHASRKCKSYFRHAHSCNARWHRRCAECSAHCTRHHTTTVGRFSRHRQACICVAKKNYYKFEQSIVT